MSIFNTDALEQRFSCSRLRARSQDRVETELADLFPCRLVLSAAIASRSMRREAAAIWESEEKSGHMADADRPWKRRNSKNGSGLTSVSGHARLHPCGRSAQVRRPSMQARRSPQRVHLGEEHRRKQRPMPTTGRTGLQSLRRRTTYSISETVQCSSNELSTRNHELPDGKK